MTISAVVVLLTSAALAADDDDGPTYVEERSSDTPSAARTARPIGVHGRVGVEAGAFDYLRKEDEWIAVTRKTPLSAVVDVQSPLTSSWSVTSRTRASVRIGPHPELQGQIEDFYESISLDAAEYSYDVRPFVEYRVESFLGASHRVGEAHVEGSIVVAVSGDTVAPKKFEEATGMYWSDPVWTGDLGLQVGACLPTAIGARLSVSSCGRVASAVPVAGGWGDRGPSASSVGEWLGYWGETDDIPDEILTRPIRPTFYEAPETWVEGEARLSPSGSATPVRWFVGARGRLLMEWPSTGYRLISRYLYPGAKGTPSAQIHVMAGVEF